MSLIYGTVNWTDTIDHFKLTQLKEELSKYPSDEFDALTTNNAAGGLYSVRLRKAPFPQEKIIQDENLVLFADARIDYREDLVEKLNLSKDALSAYSDTNLIALAYQKWGKECVDYLEGDYVFLIYHKQTKEVWGARDPVGFRPLFFVLGKNQLYFSTSLRGLLHLRHLTHGISEQFWSNRLLGLDCPPTATPHENIHQFPIGHEVSINSERFVVNRFFHWKREVSKKTSKEYEEELKEILNKAVKTRLYTDFEVGSQLSGGLDSSAINAIASKQLDAIDKNKKLWSVSSVPEAEQEHERDERPWINVLQSSFPNINTALFSLDKHPITPKEHLNLFAFMRLRRYASYPIEQQFQKHLEKHNCKTVLTGWRGDHFISRHSYFALNELFFTGNLAFFVKNFKKTRKWRGASAPWLLKKLIKSNSPISYNTALKQLLLKKEWVAPYQAQLFEKAALEEKWKKRGVEWDFSKHLPQYGNELLFYMEDMSYLNNKPIITLHPLSDRRVISFALNLPAIEFEKEGMDRSLFRRAMKNVLPEQIRLRTDKGFFNFKEQEQHQVLVQDILENKMELLKNSQFNSLIDLNEVLSCLKNFLAVSDVKRFKVDSKFIQSLNILGYLLYFSENSE